MAVVLAWLFAGVIVALCGLLVLVGRDRARLRETERRSRLGAEHARLHLSLLARAGDEMSGALESYDDALLQLLGVVVPAFADWFAVDLVDETGDVQRFAATEGDAPLPAPKAHRHPDGDVLVRRVIESGQDELLANTPVAGTQMGDRPHEGTLVRPDGQSHASRAAGVESMVIVPVEVRGLALGALSFVTAPGRRGYRLSDLETAHGLADRVAVAIERVLLWRESRGAERTAIARADQLRRLMEAALAVNAPLAEPEILEVLANHAREVLGVRRAFVLTVPFGATAPRAELMAAVSSPRVPPEDLGAVVRAACGLVVQFDRPLRASGAAVEGLPEDVVLDPSRMPPTGESWLAVPVPGSPDEIQRVIFVEGVPSVDPAAAATPIGFGPEDESVLVLLAQIASVALVNARLYQAVRGSERRLRAVVESSPLAIAELAVNGEILWWNRASEVLLGTPDADREPGTWRIPVHPDSRAAWSELLERSSFAIASVGTDIRTMGAGDDVRELSVSNAPLFDDEGHVSGILIVAEDVTERRRVLERMHQSDHLAAMARLAGGVAHDFNNLLTVILGSSDVVSRRGDIDVSLREEIDAIQRAGRRAAGLTAQLLAVGRTEVEPVELDLDAELTLMAPMLERILGEGVDLEIVPAKASARILADPSDLERVVLNLAINARDAMPHGGRFTLSWSVVEPDQGSAELGSSSGRLVALFATDSGEGMDAQTAEHCFEPFFSTKPHGHGTGLGLFAVDAIVTKAGGRIGVDTAPGRGTTFTMWFPALDQAQSAPD